MHKKCVFNFELQSVNDFLNTHDGSSTGLFREDVIENLRGYYGLSAYIAVE